MHRIDGYGATVDEQFTSGNPQTGAPATVVTPEWLNAVQGELAAFIVAGGLALDKGDNTQLVTALSFLAQGLAADAAAAGALAPQAGQSLFMLSSDGGPFRAATGAAPGTYVSDGDGAAGTVVAVGDGSAAWVRADRGPLLPRWFRAVGDGVADDTGPLRALWAVGQATGRRVHVEAPAAYYRTTGTISVEWEVDVTGDGEDVALIQCEATDGSPAFRLSTVRYLRGLRWSGFRVHGGPEAGAPIEIGYGLVRSELAVSASAENPSAPCIDGEFLGAGGVYSTVFAGAEYAITEAHQVPGVRLVTDGARVQDNDFAARRISYGRDAQFYWLECRAAGTWCWANRFWTRECQMTSGGVVALLGCRDSVIDGCTLWDMAVANGGELKNHGVWLGKHTSGLQTVHTTLRRYSRTGPSTLAAGVYDVHLENADHTHIENVGDPSGVGVTFNLNNKRVVWVGARTGVSVLNSSSATTTYIEPGKVTAASYRAPRSGAVVELTGDSIPTPTRDTLVIDTEGGAGSGTLRTIGAGEDGQTVKVRTNSSGRPITVDHAGDNVHLAAGADEVWGTPYRWHVLTYDAALAAWIE